jgi:hypothetical protein
MQASTDSDSTDLDEDEPEIPKEILENMDHVDTDSGLYSGLITVSMVPKNK